MQGRRGKKGRAWRQKFSLENLTRPRRMTIVVKHNMLINMNISFLVNFMWRHLIRSIPSVLLIGKNYSLNFDSESDCSPWEILFSEFVTNKFWKSPQVRPRTLPSTSIIFHFKSVLKTAEIFQYLGHSCPSFRMVQLGSHWMEFHEKWHSIIFLKSVKIRISLNLTRITCTLHEAVCIFMTISRSYLPRMRNISDNNVEKIIKIRILYSMTFLRKSCLFFFRWCGKYFRAGQATDDSMAHAHCMLDT
jgi:hypothetical protein